VSTWAPEWRVKIDGVEVTDTVLTDLTFSAGRANIYEQAQASYANVSLLNVGDVVQEFNIYEQITIEIKDSTATFIPIFGGYITDVARTISSTGRIQFTETITILAVGAIHRLQRATTAGVLSKDFDGEQIYTILSEILFAQWQNVAPALTWGTYDPAQTWEEAANSGLGDIDRPGDYELAARSSSITTIYDLVTFLANSGLGFIYEDAQGRISYADSTHRAEYLATNGYVDLDATQALGIGLRTTVRAGDVRNKITITYKNGQEELAEDVASQATYGVLAQNIITSIEHDYAAQDQADFYLTLRANPQPNFDSITFQLANPELDDTDRDALLNVSMGSAINLVNLPQSMGVSFQGFVEGWTMRAGIKSLAITLTMSPISFSLQAFRWNSVPASEAWNTISATLDWENATIVA